ncbi:DEAD/DEAH box helicase [Nocardia sp. NPDC050406]|uniref:DEAD/DEAH box helicase n=1 Tax=Nocardia sp. NPDC050406 TaxID=3364318 RepID=UPI0037B04CB6
MTTRSSSPAPTFADLGVRAQIADRLAADGVTAPFPIQAATLPDTLAGRDVLARGKTGSGKTLAFSIPMVDRLAAGVTRKPGQPVGLVLAPTRELATQIAATLEPLAAACRLQVTTVFGGVPQNRQARALKTADIVVACPGRLEDLMKQRLVSLDAVRITVLDEADHMADLGFLPGVTRILAATPNDGQRLLFSATLDNGVNKLVQRFMRNPLSHSVDEAHSPVPAMTHHVFEIGGADAKRDLVYALASGTGRRILFMRTKHHARRLAKQLTTAGIPATDLHGNLSQAARDRNLAAFTDGTARVLVATDIAARGVHVDDVELVVHVDPPAEHKAYLHRSGRTARAGSSGDVVTVVLPEQRRDVAVLLRKAGITVAPERVTAQSPSVTALVGETAPLVAPRPVAAGSDAERGRRGAGGGQNGRGNRSRGANPARGGGDERGNRSRGARGFDGESREARGGANGRRGGATAHAGGTRQTGGHERTGTATRGTGTRSTAGASRGRTSHPQRTREQGVAAPRSGRR